MCKCPRVSPRPSAGRAFYRPCLSVELGEQVKLGHIDVEAAVTRAVKNAILDAQWRVRGHTKYDAP